MVARIDESPFGRGDLARHAHGTAFFVEAVHPGDFDKRLAHQELAGGTVEGVEQAVAVVPEHDPGYALTHAPLVVVAAAHDFFTVEVLTWRGLVTYYVLFFIKVTNRRVSLGGITRHPDSCWMEQVARNASMQDTGYLSGCRYLLHD